MKNKLCGWISLVLVSTCVVCHAQETRIVKEAFTTVRSGAVQAGKLSRYNGNMGGIMGVDYYLARQFAHAPVSNLPQTTAVSAAPKATHSRPWLEQTARNVKAWNLKRQRRVRDERNRLDAEARQAREALEATLPRLNPAHTFQISSFEPLLAEDLPTETLPLLETPGVLYRGMAFTGDGEAVENILTNGLLIKDLGSHATTKLLALSGGMRSTVSAVRPVTNLSSLPSEALYWGTQRTGSDKKLLVIVSVDGQEQAGKTVLMSQDIPASQIAQVIAPLRIDGVTVWCDIQLTSDQTFLVTPYDLPPLAQTSAPEE